MRLTSLPRRTSPPTTRSRRNDLTIALPARDPSKGPPHHEAAPFRYPFLPPPHGCGDISVILEIRSLQRGILGRKIRRSRGLFPAAIARTAAVRAGSIATGRRGRWSRSKRRTAGRLTPTAADQPRRHQRDNANNTTSPRSPAQHALPQSGPLPPHSPERGPCHIANQNATARATGVARAVDKQSVCPYWASERSTYWRMPPARK